MAQQLSLKTIWIKDCPKQTFVSPCSNKSFYIPYPSTLESNRQQFAVIRNRKYNQLLKVNGVSSEEFESVLDQISSYKIGLTSFADAEKGLMFKVVDPITFNNEMMNNKGVFLCS